MIQLKLPEGRPGDFKNFYYVQIIWIGYELLKSVAQSVFIYVRRATSVPSFSYFLFDLFDFLANPMVA